MLLLDYLGGSGSNATILALVITAAG